MDSHDVGRGEIRWKKHLQASPQNFGHWHFIRFTFSHFRAKYLAHCIPHSKISIIRSDYGHDGFLTEGNKLNRLILNF